MDAKERKRHDRFNGLSEEEVSRRTLPDHLAPNLDVVIVREFFLNSMIKFTSLCTCLIIQTLNFRLELTPECSLLSKVIIMQDQEIISVSYFS